MRSRGVTIALLILSVLFATGSVVAKEQSQQRLVVLGIDGMDPLLLQQFMSEGRAPNLAKLASTGAFLPLGTSIPPQSPVAWSNFITGMDPGGHGIFDFIALDRKRLVPYLSIARVEKPSRKSLEIGRWRFPLGAERTLLLRDGLAFWQILESEGIPTTIFRVPANYPPIATTGRAISGMGTPDLQGTSGTFTYYTDDPRVKPGQVSGGIITRVRVRDNTVHASLEGPPNIFLEGSPAATLDLSIHVDHANPVAMIRIGDAKMLLNVGEWSDWVSVRFELMPGLVRIPGMVRFHLRQTTPYLSLYVSPVNIDPRDPAQPIATPPEYAMELAEAAGPFYTQEMPEDTKALSAGVLDSREFLAQSGLVLDERRRLLKHEIRRFKEQQRHGLLFFYFSSVDQRNHMLARQMDPKHPFHEKNTPPDLASAMRKTYQELDEIVGWVSEEIDDDTTLIVMSDHGFAPFRRQAHLNAWLEQHGYLKLQNTDRRNDYEWLQGIDWSQTRAFAIGLNSLYLNVRGREPYGIVNPSERTGLAREIADGLNAWVDADTKERVVTQGVLREEVYHGSHVEEAPDILVGYARGYRASWATTTGKIPATLIEDNDAEWSGDHCMDSRTVPGVLLANRPLGANRADLKDLPVSILAFFGLSAPPQMQGTNIFQLD